MNREIVFRGKDVKSGRWEFGYFTECVEPMDEPVVLSYITDIENNSFIVYRETVSQYTGLKDSTGKRIFEGDILEFEDLGEEGYEYKEGFDFINTASVVFNNGRFELENFWSGNSGVLEEMNNDHEEFISIFAYSKIIGNIHDVLLEL